MARVPVETVIDPDNIPPEKEPKTTPKRRSKADEISFEEAQVNLTRLFNAFSTFMKSEKEYKESDFMEEAKDLSRMAKKYDVVNMILTMFAPLFLVLGLVSKGRDIMKHRKVTPKKESKTDEIQTTGDTNNVGDVVYNGSGITHFPTQFGN